MRVVRRKRDQEKASSVYEEGRAAVLLYSNRACVRHRPCAEEGEKGKASSLVFRETPANSSSASPRTGKPKQSSNLICWSWFCFSPLDLSQQLLGALEELSCIPKVPLCAHRFLFAGLPPEKARMEEEALLSFRQQLFAQLADPASLRGTCIELNSGFRCVQTFFSTLLQLPAPRLGASGARCEN